jgi:CheY-like chemotaxis protein
MTEMIARTLGETIRVETRLAADLWPTYADRSQLETALLNLVVNARDAMPQGGSLTIETRNVELDDGYAADIVPGAYVMLSVTDTGCGIPEALLGKVFEPFFTTKDTGKGSGLGLSMVYGFVKQSGGHVRLSSPPGKGTTVTIWLPRCPDGVVPAARPASAGSEILPHAKPGETVLVVEDNEDIRRLAVSTLESLGYRVLRAHDGPSALRLVESADGARIDLLFADVVLPGGMSGGALADTLRGRRPGLSILLTSGYSQHPVGMHDGVALLDKPYTFENLARRVRQALDVSATSPDAS